MTKAGFLCLLLVAATPAGVPYGGQAAGADYLNSSVTLGGYLLKSADAKTSRDFYQYEAVNLNLLKNGLGFNGSFRYSDLYNARPQSYSYYSRLSLATLSYTSPGQTWYAGAGRIFLPALNYNVLFDGLHLRYQRPGFLHAELLGGFSLPSFYQAKLFDFDPQHILAGARLTFLGLTDTRIVLDGVTDNQATRHTGALGIYRKLGQNLRLEADSRVQYKTVAAMDASLRARYYFNQNDAMWIQAYRRDRKADTTDYYDSLINPLRYGAGYGCSYTVSPNAAVNLDYALVAVDTALGHVFSVAATLWGGYLGYEQQVGALPSLELKAGYAYSPWTPLQFSLNGGFMQYKLYNQRDYYQAIRGVAGVVYTPFPFLQATVEGQYLTNRIYLNDVRLYAGIRYLYRKPLN